MKHWHMISALAILGAILITATALSIIYNQDKSSAPTTPQPYTYTIEQTYPHDQKAFTQGLTNADGILYESTGHYGSSTLRIVDLETGTILEEVSLSDEFFGEGITIVDNTIVQLTWLSKIGFVYDKNTLSPLNNFSYATEGWGITFNGTTLIMSDGTNKLYFLDPATYHVIGHIEVYDGTTAVTNLNELEYVNGEIYANIWKQQKIAVINQQTGQVEAWIDLVGLENSIVANGENVVNGIAYDYENDNLFVTGKNWPHLYQIKLVPSI